MALSHTDLGDFQTHFRTTPTSTLFRMLNGAGLAKALAQIAPQAEAVDVNKITDLICDEIDRRFPIEHEGE